MPDSPSIMVIAGETSGDILAAELITALHHHARDNHQPPPRCFGAGGPRLAAAGVELAVDMTQHAVVGLWEVARHYWKFRQIFHHLLQLAAARRPNVILCVDFSGFNRRFAHAVKALARRLPDASWHPRLVQMVSPQVWASRPGRAKSLERDFDLLLSIFPFEKAWYAQHAPRLRVEFVGHPLFDRHPPPPPTPPAGPPRVLLLPGSRTAELKRHLPPLLGAWALIQQKVPAASAVMVLPDDRLRALALAHGAAPAVSVQVGGLANHLRQASVALACTGTVTMECAYFGVPTVTLYITSWLTYEVARRLVTVPSLTMPNLLAGSPIFPEFIQYQATPKALAQAALGFLEHPGHAAAVRAQLRTLMAQLGGPGAAARAARLVADLLPPPQDPPPAPTRS
ncbi:MAG: lipid-A-disaccharide synthase [Verrucomicrobiae bacterium]|nr:lipid-A-disaccharide synthase [Verrucomicrobiae bacterium]